MDSSLLVSKKANERIKFLLIAEKSILISLIATLRNHAGSIIFPVCLVCLRYQIIEEMKQKI